MKILAIESSCDETSAAVIENGVATLSNVVASSHEMHEKYGGIVPEVAARKQLEYIIPIITEALKIFPSDNINTIIKKEINAIAVSVGPGLIGSLLVGVETAKTISLLTDKPIIPVNHVLAHMYANFIQPNDEITFPAISLVVSGGHTELYLMKSHKDLTWLGGTIDDAAGECFDKTARLLGFGNGGGLAIQDSAKQTSHLVTRLPRPMLDKDNYLNFSFSGLKTAILRESQKLQKENFWNNDAIGALAYEVQETITDILVKKTLRAQEKYDAKSILLSGGVASNLRLREKLPNAFVPPVNLCTDNAAYIGSYAFFKGEPQSWESITAIPDLEVEVTS